jgi:hypothetical protein
MSGYNLATARRDYDENFDDYDDSYEAPAPRRQAAPAYRAVGNGNGNQLTRSQALPQALPQGNMPRRPNVPPAGRYADDAPTMRRSMAGQQSRQLSTRPVRGEGLLGKVNMPAGANSNMRLVVMGAVVLGVLVVSYLIVSFAVTTWQTWQDDMTYGRPRLTRLEANVGHNETGGAKTLLIAQNIRGQISITEFPGGDPSKTRVIVGPTLFGKDKDLVPVKLSTRDVNMDGQPDLVATVEDQQLIYINENGNFRPINGAEQAKLKTQGKEDTK